MASVELIMPTMGEGIRKAKILKWMVAVGDHVEQHAPLLEISTDKVDADVPSLVSGVLIEVFFKEGDVVLVGTVIAIIDTQAGAKPPMPRTDGSSQARPIKQTSRTPIG
jgi:2-oxoglutarate dehydrogenase E2 component (dihydrolipoamide succinyltransferase)